MSLPELTRDEMVELERVVRKFGAAQRVSLIVGFVLFPLFFGGAAVAAGLLIPEPAGALIGQGIGAVGLLLLGFLGWYWRRTTTRPPLCVWATPQQEIVQEDQYGGQAHAVELLEHEVRPLVGGGYAPGVGIGYGPPMSGSADRIRKRRLTSRALSGVVPRGEAAMFVCTPTGEVVAVRHRGELTTA